VAALVLAAHPAIGWIYLAPVALASVALLALCLRLISKPGKERALALFHASNLYLALVISMICVDTLVA
jgi:heme O synthase-like polyprenyltransferase